LEPRLEGTGVGMAARGGGTAGSDGERVGVAGTSPQLGRSWASRVYRAKPSLLVFTTPKPNYLGGQKPPRKLPKPPRKWSLAAGRQAKSAKNREPRKLNFPGCRPPRIMSLAVWLPRKLGQWQNLKCAKKKYKPPSKLVFLAACKAN